VVLSGFPAAATLVQALRQEIVGRLCAVEEVAPDEAAEAEPAS
jgi:hypothetical protein